MKITVAQYFIYLENVLEKLNQEEAYVTDLDLATGDGDHWANMHKGFATVVSEKETMTDLNLQQLFQQIGMKLMASIGGSSGILYGGAYMEASKKLQGIEALDLVSLLDVYDCMLKDIMKRGKGKPGEKTMIDALAPVVDTLREGLSNKDSEEKILESMIVAAKNGADSTKEMLAVRGRATYQADKGVGHLDPGAVTMSYQIEELCKMFLGA